jgi:hypothetical protein
MRWFQFGVRSPHNSPGRRRDERRVAYVWVDEKELDKAEGVARSLLADQGWAIESVELSMRPTPEDMASLDRAQSFAHRRALSDGAFAYYTPLEPRTAIEHARLGQPDRARLKAAARALEPNDSKH